MRHSAKGYGESVMRGVIFCTAGVVDYYLRLAVDKMRVDDRLCTLIGNPFPTFPATHERVAATTARRRKKCLHEVVACSPCVSLDEERIGQWMGPAPPFVAMR